MFTLSGLYTTAEERFTFRTTVTGLGFALLLAIAVLVHDALITGHAVTQVSSAESTKSRLPTGPSTLDIAREVIGPVTLVIAIAAIFFEDWNNPLRSLHYWPLIAEIFGSNWRTGDKLLGVLFVFTLCVTYIGFKLSLFFAVSNRISHRSRSTFIMPHGSQIYR